MANGEYGDLQRFWTSFERNVQNHWENDIRVVFYNLLWQYLFSALPPTVGSSPVESFTTEVVFYSRFGFKQFDSISKHALQQMFLQNIFGEIETIYEDKVDLNDTQFFIFSCRRFYTAMLERNTKSST